MAAILGSWKEIANYLGKGVRTVQRWEHRLGMPVHRPPGARQGVVLAFPAELDQWMHRQTTPDVATPLSTHLHESGRARDASVALNERVVRLQTLAVNLIENCRALSQNMKHRQRIQSAIHARRRMKVLYPKNGATRVHGGVSSEPPPVDGDGGLSPGAMPRTHKPALLKADQPA